jgi:2'-5' RNA ligase
MVKPPMSQTPPRKRCFIAVPVQHAVTKELHALQSRLRDDAGVAGRAIPTANFHLTLAFLGALEEDERSRVIQLLQDRAGQAEATSQPLTRIRPFPGERSRLLALEGVPAASLLALQRNLLADLQTADVPPAGAERAFRPHISLIRLRRPVDELPFSEVSIELPVRELVFYESVPEGRGVSYHRLASFSLTG